MDGAAVVLDVFSRRVVGWAMAPAQNEHLVEQALRMALGGREPQATLLHHSDRGSEYPSDASLALLHSWGIQLSMSRTGNCYDNAVMERFFGTLKRECPMHFETRQQAHGAIFEYIECSDNRVRRHSVLGYLSPVDFELSQRSFSRLDPLHKGNNYKQASQRCISLWSYRQEKTMVVIGRVAERMHSQACRQEACMRVH
jgi:transposase InsO family protein